MKEEYTEFAARFAQTIVDEDFEAAHALFAPWLQKEMSPGAFRAEVEKWLWEMNEIWGIEELIFPDAFEISHNSSTLEELRKKESWREPRKISDEVTEENFRQWMVIQFMPDETDERVELDGWFDFWFILVETGGGLRVGFFELADVD
jgi:flavodoxin